jgi:rhamnulokinase
MLGTLQNGELTLSEVRRFQNLPIEEKDSIQWNIPQLYHETLDALRGIGGYEEPIESISCNSWGADYLLFGSDGALITPTYHRSDPRTKSAIKKVLSKIPWETIYEETGVQQAPANTLFQLAVEKSRRLSQASHLMPVADGFNYLLTGVPRTELSLASTTQLYNPIANAWSERLLTALKLPQNLFAQLVPAGTDLGLLRPDLIKETGLEDTRVITSCSHGAAAALAGLPIPEGENWAYLHLGPSTVLGMELPEPLINDRTRQSHFTNAIGYGGLTLLHRPTVGLWVLDECRGFWQDKDRALDGDLLLHLAGAALPFASMINPADPRFSTPGDMPLKIQAFCKETNQVVPRKPGAIFRCILESLALFYRMKVREMESITGNTIQRLFILGNSSNVLLNHFTASALEVPIVVAPSDATAIGNVVVQALALKHISSLERAREIVRTSFKTEVIVPRPTAWNVAYETFLKLCPEEV